MDVEHVLLGIAIGDAFGAGIEFQDRDWIRQHIDFSKFVNVRYQINSSEKDLFTKNYRLGDYTDDTEMTIGVMKTLLSKEKFSKELLLKYWSAEYQKGIDEKGFGRNGHGSIRWYFNGEKSIEELREFQKNRKYPRYLPGIKGLPSDAMLTGACVLYILKHSSSPLEGLKNTINLGGDVDSIAAICTGILAGKYGLSSLPQFMFDTIEAKKYLKHLASTFKVYFKT